MLDNSVQIKYSLDKLRAINKINNIHVCHLFQPTENKALFDMLIFDLQKLVDSSCYSDLKIVSRDGEVFVHKNILAVRCPQLLQVCAYSW